MGRIGLGTYAQAVERTLRVKQREDNVVQARASSYYPCKDCQP